MTKRFLGTLFLSVLVAACAQTEAPDSEMSAESAPAPEITWEATDESASSDEEAMAEPMAPDPASLPDEFTVFFAFDSPILTPEAEAVIDQAVAAAVAKGKVGFAVVGYSDSAGSKQQNKAMSRWRALAVTDELVFRGVSETAIETDWKGDEGAISTNTPEQADRRVVIQLL